MSRSLKRRTSPKSAGLLRTLTSFPVVVAVHASIATLSALCSGSRSGRRHSQRNDATAVGMVTGLGWAVAVAGIMGLGTGSGQAAFLAVLVALPAIALVVGQVIAWRIATFWASLPGSSLLGDRSSPPFDVRSPYALVGPQRLKHLAIQGPTGSGKSTLLKNLIIEDIRHGAGLCVIDPKDDLIDSILGHIPSAREKDIVLMDASDTEWPLGFNPLAGVAPERRSLAAGELVAVFRRYFSDSWGARLEHILTNVVLALLETPQCTLLDIPRLLLDPGFGQAVMSQVSNPGVRQFFETEFEPILRRRGDALEPILNKVGPWLAYPELRNIIGQAQSSFDLRQVMDQGKVLLVRIPQGILGEGASSLLGALIVAKVQLAAHSRVDTPSEQRRPFFLYCDEFQNFATSSFSRILTEARGFKLGLICANQYPEQLSKELQLALERNVAVAIECFGQPGPYRLRLTRLEDARRLPEARPIILTPPPPLPPGDTEQAQRVRLMSRSQFGRARQDVEHAILARPIARPERKEDGSRRRTTPRTETARADLDEE